MDVFNFPNNTECYNDDINGEHGRIEERKVEALPIQIIDTQLDIEKWVNAKSIVKVSYTNHSNNTQESRYFISTIENTQVKTIADSIRSHWQIENNLHWVLDVAFREDESRIRNERTALNFSWFRKMALSLLGNDGRKMSNRSKMMRNWAKPENIMSELI